MLRSWMGIPGTGEKKKSNIPCGAGAAGRGNVWVCVAEEPKAGDKHRSSPWPSPRPLQAGFSPFSERDNPQGELLQPCCCRGSFLSFHQPSGVPPVELPGLTEQWEGEAGGHCEHPCQNLPAKLPGRAAEPRGTAGKQKDVTKQTEPRGGVGSEPALWLIWTEKSVFPIPSPNNYRVSMLELPEAEGRLGVTTNPWITPLGERSHSFWSLLK